MALIILVVTGAALIGAAYWNNNVPRMSDAEFAAALTQSIERGRAWVCGQQDKSPTQYYNASMHFLLHDMDRLHSTPVFAARVEDFLNRPLPRMNSWKRLIDPSHHAWIPEIEARLNRLPIDYRWLAYALKPDLIRLDAEAKQKLFDPESSSGLVLAHQLWALCHMRRLSDDPRVTDELISRLCQRIAREHARDILVTKLHCERPGFILMAGHPELINRRWVERIIKNQRQDGGWNDRLYALTVPTPLRNTPSDEHNTLVTLWALYQVKYAYPEAFGLPAHAGSDPAPSPPP